MTTLYRFYGQGGDLLYVGIAERLTSRLYGHERRSPWFADVKRIEVEHYATRAEAHRNEVWVIQRLTPRYNVLRYDRLVTSLTLPKRLTRVVAEYALAIGISKSHAAEKLIERGLETIETEAREKVA